MKTTATLPAALTLLVAGLSTAQADNSDYLDSVCSPEGDFTSGPIPPCIDIISIEATCAPNGTDALALEAHAQCMCKGSYFAEWLGCRQCLFDHGGMSERNLTYYKSVIATASNLLCTGTPTAPFQTLFSSAGAEVPIPTVGGAAFSDVASGNTAVSVYYTASGSQGPGQITGSATAATATVSVTTDAAATTTTGVKPSTTTGESAGTNTRGTSASTSATSSSSNVAAATGVAGGIKNLLFAMAGGALVVAL
ncbi:hypothetical protein TruAng_004988 [Truncatella angustata]|nr:hypothetical protein TruAng_004988 [Truncatella angustata]